MFTVGRLGVVVDILHGRIGSGVDILPGRIGGVGGYSPWEDWGCGWMFTVGRLGVVVDILHGRIGSGVDILRGRIGGVGGYSPWGNLAKWALDIFFFTGIRTLGPENRIGVIKNVGFSGKREGGIHTLGPEKRIGGKRECGTIVRELGKNSEAEFRQKTLVSSLWQWQ